MCFTKNLIKVAKILRKKIAYLHQASLSSRECTDSANSLHCHCFGEYLELDTLHCTSQWESSDVMF